MLFANKKSNKPSDSDHHYGHRRYENGASMILGMLLAVGAGMLWSAIWKLLHPERLSAVHAVALLMALSALIIRETLFQYMLTVAIRVQSSLLVANAWYARSDAASSVVVAAGIIRTLAGYPWFDLIAAFVVSILILRMGYTFAYNAIHDLMDLSIDSVKEFDLLPVD